MDVLIVSLFSGGAVVAVVIAVTVAALIKGDLDEPRPPATPPRSPASKPASAKKQPASPSHVPQGSASRSATRKAVSEVQVQASRLVALTVARTVPAKPTVTRPPTARPSPRPIPKSSTPASQSSAARPLPRSDATQRLKQRWFALSLVARSAVIAVAVVIVGAAVALPFVGGSRDEGSYQYGRSTESVMARSLWKTVNKVPGSNIKSIGDTCASVVDTDRNADTPQAVSMRKMDREDIIAGCIDVLQGEQRLGFLP